MNKWIINRIKSYQVNISANTKPHCRYYPTCSHYAIGAFSRYSFWKALPLTLWRILRCNPLSKGGYDPVPEKPSRLKKITNNVYYLPSRSNTDEPNIGYILNSSKAVMIDASNSKRAVKHFYRELKKNHLPYPEETLLTHHHWDHTFGLSAIRGKSYALKKTNEILEHQKELYEKHGIHYLFETKEIPLFCKDHLLLCYKHQKKHIPIQSAKENIKNYQNDFLELYQAPSNHTEDSLAILVKKDKVLFLGDAFCGEIKDYDFIHDKKTLEKQYAWLSDIDCEYVITGHGAPSTKEEALLNLKEHIENEKNATI